MDNNSSLLNTLKDTFAQNLPKILGILLFIAIGWILFKILMMVIKRLLRFSKIDTLSKKINSNVLLVKSNMQLDLGKIITVVLKWVLVLLIVAIGADFFELEGIASGLGKIISFLPTLLIALIILALGGYLASYVKNMVNKLLKSFDVGGANIISLTLFYAILVVTIIIVLEKLGINTDIITDNLSIILGALLAAVAIAIGLGSKEIVQRLLYGFYSRKNLSPGQKIRVDGGEGVIVSMDNIFLVLQSGDQKTIYPIKMIVDKKIEILEQATFN